MTRLLNDRWLDGRGWRRMTGRSRRAVLWGLALLVLVVTGCGKKDPRLQAWGGMSREEWLAQYKQRKEQELSEAEAERQSAEAKRQAEEAAAAARARKPRTQTRAKGPDPQRSLESEEQPASPPVSVTETPQPPPSDLPENFADWTLDHYQRAWEEKDPRFYPAVTALGSLHVGDPAAGETLQQLLNWGVARMRSASSGSAAADDAMYLRAVAAALLRNRTGPADAGWIRAWREALEQRDAAVAGILLELILSPSGAENDRVFQAVAEALTQLPAGESAWLVSGLETGLRGADGELRRAIWDRFANLPDSPLRKAVVDVVTRSEDANVMLVLDVLPTLPPDRQAAEWEQLQQWSFSLWRAIVPGGAESGPYRSTSWSRPAVPVLWSEEIGDKTCRALDRVVFVRESVGPVVFAASLPRPEVRAALLELFRRRWSEDPRGLLSAAEYADPGLIPILKRLLREHQDLTTAKFSPRMIAALAPAGNGPVGPRLPREMAPAQPVAGVAKSRADYQAWLDETYALIDRWMNHAAAGSVLDRRRDWDAETLLGWKVHSDDCPGYAASWVLFPADGAAEASERPTLLELAYVRLADRAKPVAVVTHYRRIGAFRERLLPFGIWLDRWEEDDGRSWTSTDVRITAAKPHPAAATSEEQDLFVEIFFVRASIALPEDREAGSSRAGAP
ncbi:MAG: hypothetical protein ACUVQQ_07900 [Thermogutta sp.]